MPFWKRNKKRRPLASTPAASDTSPDTSTPLLIATMPFIVSTDTPKDDAPLHYPGSDDGGSYSPSDNSPSPSYDSSPSYSDSSSSFSSSD